MLQFSSDLVNEDHRGFALRMELAEMKAATGPGDPGTFRGGRQSRGSFGGWWQEPCGGLAVAIDRPPGAGR